MSDGAVIFYGHAAGKGPCSLKNPCRTFNVDHLRKLGGCWFTRTPGNMAAARLESYRDGLAESRAQLKAAKSPAAREAIVAWVEWYQAQIEAAED